MSSMKNEHGELNEAGWSYRMNEHGWVIYRHPQTGRWHTGAIAFFKAAGTAIGTATTFTPGDRVSGVGSASVRKRRGVRALIRGVVTVTRTAGSGVPWAPAATLDTFDSSTGATNHRYAGEEAISPEI